MWICLNDAFFSIVKDFEKPGNLLVRARDATSIPNVFGKEVHVEKRYDRDYLYRASLPRIEVAEVIANELGCINYGNFKASVKDPLLHGAYLGVWEEMFLYQREVEAKNKPHPPDAAFIPV